jgi:hypothetical protein
MCFSTAVTIYISYKTGTNPFLGIDLVWADIEEDDSGAIIGLKRDRMARKQHRLLSVTQNSIVDGDDASNDNDLSNARKSDGIQQVPNNQINTTQNSISTSPASIKILIMVIGKTHPLVSVKPTWHPWVS